MRDKESHLKDGADGQNSKEMPIYPRYFEDCEPLKEERRGKVV